MSELNPQRWECPECRFSFYDNDGWEKWHCPECGSEMEQVSPEGHTENDRLRKFIEEWRDRRANENLHPAHIEVADLCNELEELLDDE